MQVLGWYKLHRAHVADVGRFGDNDVCSLFDAYSQGLAGAGANKLAISHINLDYFITVAKSWRSGSNTDLSQKA